MGQSHYTKGEWKVKENSFLKTRPYMVKAGEQVIANINSEADAHLISASPDMAVAGQGLDRAIGVAIMEIAQTKGLDTKLISTIQAYILPAQEKWRKALAKADGKET